MKQKQIRAYEDISQILVRYVLWVFLLINICSLFYYQFSNIRSDFYHEAAYPYLYAKSDLETNSIFTSRFSAREIAPISWPLVIHILMLVGLKPTFLLVGISNSIFMLFSVVVITWFGKNFELSKTKILLVLVLFTTVYGIRPFRYSWMDHIWIWPMNSYGIYELLSLILCVLTFKMLNSRQPATSLLKTIMRNKYYLLVFFLFGLNHNRGMFEIYGPIGFSLLVLVIAQIQNQDKDVSKKYSNLLIATFFATLLGRIVIGFFTIGVPQYTQKPSQYFTTLDPSNFTYKLLSPIFTILQVFGINPTDGLALISLNGIRILSLFGLALFIVFYPISKYIQGKNFEKLSFGARFMYLHLLYFVIVSFFTALLTNTAGVVRYSIPLVISAIFFVPFMFSENQIKQALYTFSVLALLAPNVINGPKILNNPINDTYRQTSNYQLTESLLKRNLNYGFAGPWTEDVLVIPFYSENKIHISLIDVSPLRPHIHADKSWFQENDHQGETFIAIPTTLIPADEKIVELLKIANYGYVVDKWTVLVFEQNPVKWIGSTPEL